MTITRRQFIAAGLGTCAAGCGLGFYTWRIEPHWVRFVRMPLPVANLPADLDGALLVQLSDLHVGPQVDSRFLIRTLKRVGDMNPRFVVFTGDFVSYRAGTGLRELSRVLRAWPAAEDGSVAVLGNHDYGHRWRQPRVADEVVRRASDAGIKVLRNERATFGGLDITGFDDLWSPRFDPAAALKDADPKRPSIVLCHNPDALDEPVWGSYQGWVLSGHTHGGQCKPPFLPPPLLPIRNTLYTAGEIDLKDGRHLYVNRGLGHLMRVRFNVRPEVTVFTLRRAMKLREELTRGQEAS